MKFPNVFGEGKHTNAKLIAKYGMVCKGGKYDGSIFKIVHVGNPNSWRQQVTIDIDGKHHTIVFSKYDEPHFKKSYMTLRKTTDYKLLVTTFEPVDCFGNKLEPGTVIAYIRHNRMTFGRVVSINDVGASSVTRFYNTIQNKKTRPDTVSFKFATETVVITKHISRDLLALALAA